MMKQKLILFLLFAIVIKLYGKADDYTQDYLYKYDLKGLKTILVYPDGYSNYWAGYYYPYQIRLYSSDEKVFVHELAHHYDYLETKNYQRHTPNFYRIFNAISP